MQVCAIDLVLGDCDARDVNLEESDHLMLVTGGTTHISPSRKLTSWLANSTTSIQASHAGLDSHSHELVVIMSRQGFSKRLFVIQERSKVELLVPCKLKVQCSQFVVAMEGLASRATCYSARQSLLMSNLGIVLLSLLTFCLESFDVRRQLVVVFFRTVVRSHLCTPSVIVTCLW